MPRNPSPAQREASRANGRKSRGPQGEAKRACRNSCKTGLRSRLLALEESYVQSNERSGLWYDYYQPQSPATFHLANECSHVSIIVYRCNDYRQAEIDQQRAAARKDWVRQSEEKVGRLAKQVDTNPAAAVAALGTFGFGVHWLGSCFQELIQEVQTQGYLSEDSLQWAVRCYGVTPTPQQVRGDVITYLVSLYNLVCTPTVGPEVIDAWLEPAHRPDVLRDKTRAEVMGADVTECRQLLLTELEFERERLTSEEVRLTRDIDGPSLESVLKRASILTEEAARRGGASHGESRASFRSRQAPPRAPRPRAPWPPTRPSPPCARSCPAASPDQYAKAAPTMVGAASALPGLKSAVAYAP